MDGYRAYGYPILPLLLHSFWKIAWNSDNFHHQNFQASQSDNGDSPPPFLPPILWQLLNLLIVYATLRYYLFIVRPFYSKEVLDTSTLWVLFLFFVFADISVQAVQVQSLLMLSLLSTLWIAKDSNTPFYHLAILSLLQVVLGCGGLLLSGEGGVWSVLLPWVVSSSYLLLDKSNFPMGGVTLLVTISSLLVSVLMVICVRGDWVSLFVSVPSALRLLQSFLAIERRLLNQIPFFSQSSIFSRYRIDALVADRLLGTAEGLASSVSKAIMSNGDAKLAFSLRSLRKTAGKSATLVLMKMDEFGSHFQSHVFVLIATIAAILCFSLAPWRQLFGIHPKVLALAVLWVTYISATWPTALASLDMVEELRSQEANVDFADRKVDGIFVGSCGQIVLLIAAGCWLADVWAGPLAPKIGKQTVVICLNHGTDDKNVLMVHQPKETGFLSFILQTLLYLWLALQLSFIAQKFCATLYNM